jgi:FkbM family methyltransferase
MPFISYSQNLEDVMLWRALKHVEHGYYVDVGANDPKLFSMTRAFYDRGWHGINVDPMTFTQLACERTRDVNLELVVSNEEGEVNFYAVSESTLSTTDPDIADRYRQAGYNVTEKKVQSLTLSQILGRYAEPTIHFMSIDVEGSELKVLQGLDLARWRPWILLVEATIPTTTLPSFESWEPYLTNSGYEFVYFDGVNRFYIAGEHPELKDAFKLPPNLYDEFVFVRELDMQKELIAKEKFIQSYQNSYSFWLANSPFRRIRVVQAIVEKTRGIRQRFMPRS